MSKTSRKLVSSKVKKYSHVFQYFFISGIILLVMFGGGYLVFVNKTIRQNSPNKVTADWKIFTNTKYHYSFKYPSHFTITEKYEKSTESYSYLFTTGKIVDGQQDWSGFRISVDSYNGKTLDQTYNQDPRYKFGITPMPRRGNADEVYTMIYPDGLSITVYRVGNMIFLVMPDQNSNVLDDGSDAPNFQQIFDSITFQH